MTLQESALLLGNLGRFVSALAVVETLSYLALQVRQAERATRAQTVHAVATERVQGARRRHLAGAGELRPRAPLERDLRQELTRDQRFALRGALLRAHETKEERT